MIVKKLKRCPFCNAELRIMRGFQIIEDKVYSFFGCDCNKDVIRTENGVWGIASDTAWNERPDETKF